MTIEIIAAVSKNLVIGTDDNKLPWKIPEDLVQFKNLTTNHVVVMGKNTFLSLPNGKPLPNRLNVVVTSTPDIFIEQDNLIFTTFDNLSHVIKNIKDTFKDKKIFIIGGSGLFQHFISSASTLHLTHIDRIVNGSVKFPCFVDFQIEDYSEAFHSTNESCSYRFIKYTKSSQLQIVNDVRYLKLAQQVLNNGKQRKDRTGTGTISVFGKQIRFNIKDTVPLLTTKFVPWKACIRELLWFLNGDTNSKHLKEQGVNIWNGNTTRAFLDKRGLSHLPEGDIGAGYGFQWRHFGANYKTCESDYDGEGFDQIKDIIEKLKTDPSSRRIFMSAWNPLSLKDMALPPCHVSAQFYVYEEEDGNYLSCHMYQRSVDTFLGLPFNIFSYTVLTYILATMTDMKPYELVISTGDTHVYCDHIEQIKTQITRVPISSPKLIIDPSIKDKPLDKIDIKDFEVIGYFHHDTIKGNMSA